MMGRAKSKRIKDLERYVTRLKYGLPTPNPPEVKLIRNPRLKPLYIKHGTYSYSTRELVLAVRGNTCKLCGYSIVEALEIHHIDGNHFNNLLSNIAVLCANCHRLVTKGEKQYPINEA